MPVLAILTIVAIIALVLFWIKQGFLSALLNLVCVVVAGCIAFALWEHVSYFILANAPDRGMFEFVSDAAFALGLALPFILTMVILRPLLDKIVPANAICTDAVSSAGGAVCGLLAAVLTTGIAVLSISTLRFGPSFQGYEPLAYSTEMKGRGAVVRQKQTLRPYVDEIAAAFFSYVSRTTFTPGEEHRLARWYPDLHLVPASLRMTFDGTSRNTTRPKDFTVVGRYTVGDVERGEDLESFLRTDGWTTSPQWAVDVSGRVIPRGHIEGFIVNFDSTAREKGGASQVIVGNGQLHLVVENTSGDTKTLFPIAIISREQARARALGRWRFDAPNNFITSLGGDAQIPNLVEFAVPTGYRPIGLYVKGVRHHVTETVPPERAFSTQFSRFSAVNNGTLVAGFTAATPERTGSQSGLGELPPIDGDTARLRISTANQPPRNHISMTDAGIAITPALGFTIRLGAERRLKVEQDPTGRFNMIVDGEETFSIEEIRANRAIERNLQINRFQTTPDTVLVQVDVSINRPMSLMSQAALNAGSGKPILWSKDGQQFEAIGYVYEDATTYKVRYTPGHPIGGVNDAPILSRTSPDRKLKFIFRCSMGSDIAAFSIGSKLVASWQETPIPLTQ